MEKDAIIQELASLETQLSSSEKLIISLTEELDKQKLVVCFGYFTIIMFLRKEYSTMLASL